MVQRRAARNMKNIYHILSFSSSTIEQIDWNFLKEGGKHLGVRVIVLNATFNNISVIS